MKILLADDMDIVKRMKVIVPEFSLSTTNPFISSLYSDSP